MVERPVVLVLTAHADDAEFFAGGTLSKLATEGHRIIEVIATDNGRGSFELDSTALVAQSREVEAKAAAKVIGKEDVVFLGHADGYLNEVPPNALRERYIRFIRRFRPKTVFTFDAWAPFEPHPDHRHVAFAAVEALAFSHMPLFHPEHAKEGDMPHLAPERYFFAKNGERCNKVVDISAFIEKKIDALCAHESQMKMTIDDLRMSISAAGRHTEVLGFLDRDNYRPALDMFIRAWAQGVGKKAGVEFGEEFRFEHAAAMLDAIQG
ncbi:MAG: PIG-L family deacetylase [Deltaproteobacteria bacterium]|nr:PIG-L family deacetylase [Deltaproteobacteria bacterium]